MNIATSGYRPRRLCVRIETRRHCQPDMGSAEPCATGPPAPWRRLHEAGMSRSWSQCAHPRRGPHVIICYCEDRPRRVRAIRAHDAGSRLVRRCHNSNFCLSAPDTTGPADTSGLQVTAIFSGRNRPKRISLVSARYLPASWSTRTRSHVATTKSQRRPNMLN
jgi:hypothetical protein